MKSVGEAMAIGRTFQESLQKALRSLETGLTGLDEIAIEGFDPAKGVEDADNKAAIRAALGTPTPDRLLKVAQAMRLGASDELIHNACRIDPWFLARDPRHRRDAKPRSRPRACRRPPARSAGSRPWAFPTRGSAS